jgi:hypothetical protein
MEGTAREKRSSLFITYEEKQYYNIDPLATGLCVGVQISEEFETVQPKSGGKPKQFFQREGSEEVGSNEHKFRAIGFFFNGVTDKKPS